MRRVILFVLTIHIVENKLQDTVLQDKDAQTLKYEQAIHQSGTYKLAHESNKAITQEHVSKLAATDTGKTIVKMEGVSAIVTPDKTFYEVQYISDEHGYRPRFYIRTPGYVRVPIPKNAHHLPALKLSDFDNSLRSTKTKVLQPSPEARPILNTPFTFKNREARPTLNPSVTFKNPEARPILISPITSKAENSFYKNKEVKEVNRVALPSFPGYQSGSNGVIQAQSGKQRATNSGSASSAIQGVFSFIAPNNITYEVHYTSDENGYRPRISIKTPVTQTVAFELPVLSETQTSNKADLYNKINPKA